MSAVRVLLVEDNHVFRDTLELLLGLREEVEVVGSVEHGGEAATLVEQLRPDVVLLDYRLPGMNGLEVTRAVHGASPDTAVVCLTASVSKREVDELYAAGAAACLTKDAELDEIVAAVVAAAG